MIKRSTIVLLRFPFSFFLLPVYLFALATVPVVNAANAWLLFFILHGLVYPSSNGYNSYMDRDQSSIGGLRNPPAPDKELFVVSILMDLLALILGFLISPYAALGLLIYILASRAYSYRGIRLKKYPLTGYLTVIICQGALIYSLVYYGVSKPHTGFIPWLPALASSLLIGGFYPLTQIYQHEEDEKDGVKTISGLLGFRGTFVFTAFVYAIAMTCLAIYFYLSNEFIKFLVLATFFLPVLVFFFKWANLVWKQTSAANFNNTMRMNVLASVCTCLGFLILLTWRWFE